MVTPINSARPGFRTDINALRALAVMTVVLFHLGAPAMSGGFVGVDVFFVISGLLMTKIIVRGMDGSSFSLLAFYRDRFARIVPALAVMVLAVLMFSAIFVEPVTLAETAREAAGALAFVSNIQFWLGSGYFDIASQSKWLLHTWSLGVEWWFYILYPILLMSLRRFGWTQRSKLTLVACMFGGSLALSIVAGLFPGTIYAFGFYMLPTRAWEMLAGGLVVLLPLPKPSPLLALVGAALIILSLAVITEMTPWPSYVALAPVLGSALFLAARTDFRAYSSWPIRELGNASYSIYLWHWPIFVAFRYFGQNSVAASVCALVLALTAGWLSYRFIERRAQSWLKRYRTGVAISLGASAALAAAAVGITWSGGLPFRIKGDPEVYRDAVMASNDRLFQNSGCREGLSVRTGDIRPCVIGSAHEGRDVLVLGDSFAEQWFARAKALEPKLTDHAIVFLTKGGCPPFPGVERRRPDLQCVLFNERARVEARKARYGSVIYVAMWSAYFKLAAPDLTASAGPSVQRLTADIDAIRRSGKQVTIVLTAPYPDLDETAAFRSAVFSGHGVAPSEFWFSDVKALSEPVDRMLQTLASRGVTVIDPSRSLCGEHCPLLVEGRPIYSDSAHLRSAYTAKTGGFLDGAFLNHATGG